METNIKLLRHYIFINPNDIHGNLTDNSILNEIKIIHMQQYSNNEIIKYWGYDDISMLLQTYDKELYELYICLNY